MNTIIEYLKMVSASHPVETVCLIGYVILLIAGHNMIRNRNKYSKKNWNAKEILKFLVVIFLSLFAASVWGEILTGFFDWILRNLFLPWKISAFATRLAMVIVTLIAWIRMFFKSLKK